MFFLFNLVGAACMAIWCVKHVCLQAQDQPGSRYRLLDRPCSRDAQIAYIVLQKGSRMCSDLIFFMDSIVGPVDELPDCLVIHPGLDTGRDTMVYKPIEGSLFQLGSSMIMNRCFQRCMLYISYSIVLYFTSLLNYTIICLLALDKYSSHG